VSGDHVSESNPSSVTCYQCGQPEIDPESDYPNSYCDATVPSNNCDNTKKMYNLTCDIMDKIGPSPLWTRKCPNGVKSCFYADGRYDDQAPKFRGCAGSQYEHDDGCSRSMQTVTINSGKSNAEVEISLCYCHGDTCNQDLSGAPRMTKQSKTLLSLAGFISFAAMKNYGPLGMFLVSAAVAQPTFAEGQEDRVTCYACGLPDIDPHVDNPGSFCDASLENNNCPPTSKIYNFSCDVMDSMGASDYWIRTCPMGIKSCFIAQGDMGEGEKPAFRGCAGAPYALDEKCDQRVQAVSVSATSNVDVDVRLCYCNSDVCNQDLSGAQRITTKALIILMSTMVMCALL